MTTYDTLPEAPYDFVIAARPVYSNSIRSERKSFFGVLPVLGLAVLQIVTQLRMGTDVPSASWRLHVFVPALLVSVVLTVIGAGYSWFAARQQVLAVTHDSLTYRESVTKPWRLARFPRSAQARRTKTLAWFLFGVVLVAACIGLGFLMLSPHFHEHAILMLLALVPFVSCLAARRCVAYLTITNSPRFASAAFNDAIVARNLGRAQYKAEKSEASTAKQLPSAAVQQ